MTSFFPYIIDILVNTLLKSMDQFLYTIVVYLLLHLLKPFSTPSWTSSSFENRHLPKKSFTFIKKIINRWCQVRGVGCVSHNLQPNETSSSWVRRAVWRSWLSWRSDAPRVGISHLLSLIIFYQLLECLTAFMVIPLGIKSTNNIRFQSQKIDFENGLWTFWLLMIRYGVTLRSAFLSQEYSETPTFRHHSLTSHN